MPKILKILIVIVVVGAIAVGAAFLVSRYLLSKLDGTGPVPAQQNLQQYSSEEGITFQYPESYELSSRHDGNAERSWDVLLLLPKGYVPPQGGEGPPAISVSIFSNPEQLDLASWVKGDSRSNWKLAAPGATLASTTVGGVEALSYSHSGLYEFDATVIAHNGKIFLFEAGWQKQDDQIRLDFARMLDTVQFN